MISITTSTTFARTGFFTITDWIRTSAAMKKRKPVPRKANTPAGAARFTFVFISRLSTPEQSKELCLAKHSRKKILGAGEFLACSAHAADYRERADNSQSESFVDQSIDLVHTQRRVMH